MTTILERVRQTCAAVARQARHVQIAHEALSAYARNLTLGNPAGPSPDPVHWPLRDEATTVAYVILVGTLNFGSGYFPHLVLEPGQSGYERMALGVRRWVEEVGVPSSVALTRVRLEDCVECFGQPPDDGQRSQLMSHFANALNQLGELLERRYNASYSGLVRAARHKASRLVLRLAEMPAFRDQARYAGRPVYFYKRAQLVAADLHRALAGRGLGRFTDLDRLTAFADNVIPHVLRRDGLLHVDAELARRLDAGTLLPAGSAPEVELRACAVTVCEGLTSLLASRETPPATWQLDFALWLRGQGLSYQVPPPHATHTLFY